MLFKRNKTSRNRDGYSPGKNQRFTYYSSNRRDLKKPPGLFNSLVEKARSRSLFSWLLALVILLSLGYMAYLEPVPRVILDDVASSNNPKLIQREDTEYTSSITALLKESVFNRNKFTFNAEALRDKIKNRFPELSFVRISLPVGGQNPLFKLEFAEGAFILASDLETAVLDKSGKALLPLNKADKSATTGLVIISDETGSEIIYGQQVISAQTLDFVNNISSQFAHAGIKINRLVLPVVANELHVYPDGEGYYVKFALDGDPRLQTGSYFAFKESDKTAETYIDVRVSGKVFYK